ncbi:cysteine dioxygenase family protein [bacterium]|nr:cysteine dioxygenase family protein [bacterium]
MFDPLLEYLQESDAAEAQHFLLQWLQSNPLNLSFPNPQNCEPYGRFPLARNKNGEVILIHWRPHVFCAPHDHGLSHGYVLLIRGRFIERYWKKTSNGIEHVHTRIHQAPAVVKVNKRTIHDMKCFEDGVGIHFYLPGIHAMQVYDVKKRETLVVADNCGAWIPRNERLILRRTAWR